MIIGKLFKEHPRIAVALATVALVAGGALYFLASPESGIYPRCTFKMLTGLSCPGCGFQRSIHALLHGHFLEAVGYNAILPLLFVVLALLALASIPSERLQPLRRVLTSSPFILSILILLILWTILRNLLGI